MFIKKKTIIVSLLSALVIGVVCTMVVNKLILQSLQFKNSDLYGSYQISINENINDSEYIAIIPPLESDANENKGQFEWYDVNEKMLNHGSYKVDAGGFATFYVDGKSIATLCIVNKKYYFIDNSLEAQEIIKISNEAIVSTPY